MSDSPVRAVTFDLDGTLCTYCRSPGEVLAVAFDRVGVDPLFPVEAYYERFDEFAERANGMADLRERCFRALAAERGYDSETGAAVARAFAAERDHRDVVALPGAREVVERLEGAYRLGVVTNGPTDAQRAKIEGVGLSDAFEVVVCAGGEIPAKPAVEPFERALSALSVAAGEAAHVGDSAADVTGANRAGVRSVLVGDPFEGGPTPTDRVDLLDAIPACWS
ncbi:HAD family hydrolase [Halomarina litorea]|uniref:HAD family hydrolase n=1 Tax=Halomarina litorea TaxID=2961595 RepID=UPI0020C337FA|nr:HAD family hydrolase [Halomarina sp. BCD28]